MSDYFNTVEEAMDRLEQGGFIILSDNEDRENEGDLVALAQDVQADIIYDMLHEANG
jgi:3,4-dihydroxy 2-butanone 4-phosphate synthase/GTP cyclohydrolase II